MSYENCKIYSILEFSSILSKNISLAEKKILINSKWIKKIMNFSEVWKFCKKESFLLKK